MDCNSNVFTFHGNNMIMRAKGPNMDKHINISSSFRSNLLSSTMNLPRNFERQGYAESTVSQRSMFYGRERSPTSSVRSDFQPRNFHQPFNQGYSHRSTYSGRGRSPASMRSIDSSASVATDIVQAIKNGNFNKNEWRLIEQALKNKRKRHCRRRTEKRRKVKTYFRKMMNRSGDDSDELGSYSRKVTNLSGDDSGELGSSSSISSDDCASTRTGYNKRYDRNYKENVPQTLTSYNSRSLDTEFRKDNRGTREHERYEMENPFRRDIHSYDPKNTLTLPKNTQSKPNNVFHSQINDKNTFSSQKRALTGPKNINPSQSDLNTHGNVSNMQRNTMNASIYSTKSLQNTSVISQKDRPKSRVQFPSQRFNNTIMTIEEHEKKGNKLSNKDCSNNIKRIQTANVVDNTSENDEIFLDQSVKPQAPTEKNYHRQKRTIECLDDAPVSAKKKYKTTSLNNNKPGQKTKNDNRDNDFVFAKPCLPVRKKPIEKLISKSAKPFSDIAFNVQEDNTRVQAVALPSPEKEAEHEPAESTQLTNSDVSMRPSFMKRKLFTQTLDVTERKNNSSESLSIDSPQSNIYSALSREKHRTRKLVSSQSLLSRDVNQDDNNLLDLIHKIVPPSQVNTTNISKPSHTRFSGTKNASGDDDKWDITSILSTCNNDSVSDTYTDDEIFKVTNGDEKNKLNDKSSNKKRNANSDKKKTSDKTEIKKDAMMRCNVVVQKLPIESTSMEKKLPIKAGLAKTATFNVSRIDAFWNTDVESDYECVTPRAQRENNLPGTLANYITTTPKQSCSLEVRSNGSANKICRNTKTLLNSLDVNNTNTAPIKTLKKQTIKEISNKPSTKTSTLKDINHKEARIEQSDKMKKEVAPKVIRTRRQKSLSSVAKSEEKCRPLKDDLPIKTKCKEATGKPSNAKKPLKEKVTKTQASTDSTKTHRNRSLNDSQPHTGKTKKPKLEKNTKTQPKTTTIDQDDVESIENNMLCKVLRARVIDLSSSFNSDKFDLTGMSRVRKSLTPRKRISFNKSRNATVNKGRRK